MPGGVWDADQERKLLMYVAETHPKLDFALIAKLISTKDSEFTANAVSKKYARMRQAFKEAQGNDVDGGAAGVTSTEQASPKKQTTAAPKSSGKRGRPKKPDTADGDEEEGEEMAETPSKKPRGRPEKNTAGELHETDGNGATTTPVKKSRGRPRKNLIVNKQAEETGDESEGILKKARVNGKTSPAEVDHDVADEVMDGVGETGEADHDANVTMDMADGEEVDV